MSTTEPDEGGSGYRFPEPSPVQEGGPLSDLQPQPYQGSGYNFPDTTPYSGSVYPQSSPNTFGKVSLGGGVVVIFLEMVRFVAVQGLIGDGGISSIAAVTGFFSFGIGVAALVAVGFGIGGLLKKGASKATAGIGLGIGGSTLFVMVFTLVVGAIMAATS